MLPRLLIVTALVLATGCSTGSDPDTAAPASPAAPASAAPSVDPGSPEPAPSATARLIEVTYRGGEVTGVEPRVPVALGEQVVLRVTSDVTEEIHVHGYDVYADIPAGGTGEVAFTADLAGSWEVELHEAGRPMFQLRVS